MGSDLNWFGKVVEVLGPVATVLFALVVLLLFLYRRDHLVKAMLDKEARDRMVSVMDRNAAGMEKLAESVARLSETNRSTGEQYTRQIEQMISLTESRHARRRSPRG